MSTNSGLLTKAFEQFIRDLLNALGTEYVANPQLITFTSVKMGSLIINGAVSIGPSSNPSTIYNNLQNSLQSGNTISGYQITSSTIQSQGVSP